jgi:hypothetical protein
MHGHWNAPAGTISDVDSDGVGANPEMDAGSVEQINMGIGIVVPAQRIFETLNHPDLVAMRAKMDQDVERLNWPTPDEVY